MRHRGCNRALAVRIVIFGLTVSSSYGNGHATLWRGLLRALADRGHRVTFYERDVPYYAAHRDLDALPDGTLRFYAAWDEVLPQARRELADADAALVTSYCPDGIAAAALVLDTPRVVRVFYDLDTPVTLARLAAGQPVPYLPPEGLHAFDLVLSYTGGRALALLRERLGARRTAPLYGHVDPAVHRPAPPVARYHADLSYLGTYAADRQAVLERLFVGAARAAPRRRFLIGGAQYPPAFPWTPNIHFKHHVPPAEHPAFFSSSSLTLNVTRDAMARLGHCPSGRLFEAAACGAAIVSDDWDGLSRFFAPGEELLVARHTSDVLAALDLGQAALATIGRRARERTLAEHTSACRAAELERLLEKAGETERETEGREECGAAAPRERPAGAGGA
ncbi:MAG TPA: glycosyltransferase [Gemmatimonadaceae bacterium]|nr:glycosyltransferase [Gemmatimonadaceae bacterium]